MPTTLNPESMRYCANRPVPVPTSRIVLQFANVSFIVSRSLFHNLGGKPGPSRGVVNPGHTGETNRQIMLPQEEQIAFSEIRKLRSIDSELRDPAYNHPTRGRE